MLLSSFFHLFSCFICSQILLLILIILISFLPPSPSVELLPPPLCHFFLILSRLQSTPGVQTYDTAKIGQLGGNKTYSNGADWSSCSGLWVKRRRKSSSAEWLLIQVENSQSDQKWGWGCHAPVAVKRPALSVFRLTFSKLPWAEQYILDHKINVP